MGLASFAASAVGLLLGQLWFTVWELVRIGNDHFGGSRAARNLWADHSGELFIACMLVFWVALRCWVMTQHEAIAADAISGPAA